MKDLFDELENNYCDYQKSKITFKSYKLKNKQFINLWNLKRELEYYRNK